MWSQPLEAPPGFTARSVRPRSWSGAQLDQSGNVYQAADWRKVTSVNFIFFCAWMILEGEYFNDVPRAFCAGGVNRTYPGAARAMLWILPWKRLSKEIRHSAVSEDLWCVRDLTYCTKNWTSGHCSRQGSKNPKLDSNNKYIYTYCTYRSRSYVRFIELNCWSTDQSAVSGVFLVPYPFLFLTDRCSLVRAKLHPVLLLVLDK